MDRRTRRGIFILWIGAFIPIIASTAKTVSDVTGGLGPLDIVRGVGPVAFYFLALVITPTPKRPRRFGVMEFAALTFLFLAAASSLWSVDMRTTLLKSIPLVFTYLCVMRIGRLYPTPSAALHGVVTVAHLIMLSVMIQWAVIPSQAFAASSPSDPIRRLGSLYPVVAPNLIGVIALTAIVGILLRVGPKVTRGVLVGPALIGVYLTILIASRSRTITVIALAVILIAALIAMHRTTTSVAVGLAAIALNLVTLGFALQQSSVLNAFYDFFLRGQDSRNLSTLTGRTVIWDRALIAWEQNPVVGYGYYAGHRIYLASIDPIFNAYSNLDSTWIEMLVNLGYLGTGVLALYAASGFVRVVREPLLSMPERALAVLLVGATLIISFFNPALQSPSTTMILFGVVVFSCCSVRQARQSQALTDPETVEVPAGPGLIRPAK